MGEKPIGINFYEKISELEAELIKWALRETGGNQTQAANLLSMNRTSLFMKMKKLGLSNTQHDKIN